MRHKAGSTVYQNSYHNARMNAVVQDAFLGRGTKSPYLALLNHMGLRSDENAPKTVPHEVMEMLGPDRNVRRLQGELDEVKSRLSAEYGRPSNAPADQYARYSKL